MLCPAPFPPVSVARREWFRLESLNGLKGLDIQGGFFSHLPSIWVRLAEVAPGGPAIRLFLEPLYVDSLGFLTAWLSQIP